MRRKEIIRIFALLNTLCEKVDMGLRVPISRIALASLFEHRAFDLTMGQTEEWRMCKELDNLYEVSDKGGVRSIDRTIKLHDGRIMHYSAKMLRPVNKGNGYYVVNIRGRLWYIHRLVALAFLPNPLGMDEVNHKDENPANNRVENLEWCSHRYNLSYGTASERMVKKRYEGESFGERGVVMLSLNNEFIKSYRSTRAAMRETGIASSSISDCCRGYRRKSAGGYRWMFKKDYDNRDSTNAKQETPSEQ